MHRYAISLSVAAVFLASMFVAFSGGTDPYAEPEVTAPTKVQAGSNFQVTASDCDTPITVTITWTDTGGNVGGSPRTTPWSPNTGTYGPAGNSNQVGDRTLKVTATDSDTPPNSTVKFITVSGS